jgi:putative membrane protein
MLKHKTKRPNVWKGLAAGVAGGLAGTVVMTQFQNGWKKATDALDSYPSGNSRKEEEENEALEGEDATMKVAGKVAGFAGRKLSRRQKTKGGMIVHYAFGTALGALYGMAVEFAPATVQSLNPVLSGVGYGGAVLIGADEFAVPALGLSQTADKAPLSSHLYGLASHTVYGVTEELVRKAIRKRI